MKNTMLSTNTFELAHQTVIDDPAEALLTEAGFSFEVVATCPAPDCTICVRLMVSAAA